MVSFFNDTHCKIELVCFTFDHVTTVSQNVKGPDPKDARS